MRVRFVVFLLRRLVFISKASAFILVHSPDILAFAES